MTEIIVPVAIVAGMGLALGIGLGIASVVLRVKTNEKEQKILEVLPGANCGGCSFAGCADYAKALATGNVKTTLCAVGGSECVKKISAILGVEAAETRKKVAFVSCRGDSASTSKAMDYAGISTCYAAKLLVTGDGKCTYGCIGKGDCVKVCEHGALSLKDGIASVDCAKCVGCGLCVQACPKKMISLIYAGNFAKLGCKNCDKGGDTRKACTAGCIGCGKCAKTCPSGAITISENHAVFDHDKCTGCGECAAVCPVKCIII